MWQTPNQKSTLSYFYTLLKLETEKNMKDFFFRNLLSYLQLIYLDIILGFVMMIQTPSLTPRADKPSQRPSELPEKKIIAGQVLLHLT